VLCTVWACLYRF